MNQVTDMAYKKYYVEDENLVKKANSLMFSRRKKYTVLKNNPFGYKEGIHFTGTGLQSAISKCVVDFVNLHKENGEIVDSMFSRIRNIVKAELVDTLVHGMNGDKSTSLCETQFDVENTKSCMLFSNFFYERETDRIYSWSVKEIEN